MASEPKTIAVAPGSEIDRLLDEAARTPLRLVRDGVRFRLGREDEDVWAGYDPERALAGMRAAAGSWTNLDAEAMKEFVYRAREEGTRPPKQSCAT
jgi:hypothetical protein